MPRNTLDVLPVITLSSGKKIYVSPKGLRRTGGGKVLHPAVAMLGLSKGDKRRVRRILDATGHRDLTLMSMRPALSTDRIALHEFGS